MTARDSTAAAETSAVASDVVLDVAGLRAGYGHVPVLHGIDFQLKAGEAVGIVGHNGVGKTTFLKTLIGLVLAQGPWLLLLDEPAAGITGAEADQLVRIIHEVNQKATVVVVDHDMQFVRMLGGRVTVMHQGAVLREGPVDDVLVDAKVREVYIGSRAK